jgi:hypothetical protein
MVGHNSGLAKQMKDICSNMLSIHCVAHRLQLAVIDVSKDIGYLTMLREIYLSSTMALLKDFIH